jgi:hypothetical protein
MPVNVLTRGNKRYLVAPRGYTEWVRNAIAAGRVSLRKGRRSEEFGIRLVSDEEKPEILKSYLDRVTLVELVSMDREASPAGKFPHVLIVNSRSYE